MASRIRDIGKNLVDTAALGISRNRLPLLQEIFYLRQLFAAYDIETVLDVGANRGQYAKRLRKLAGYKDHIISVEPTPGLADILRTASASDSRWSVIEAALTDRPGPVILNIARDSELNSLLDARDNLDGSLGRWLQTTDRIEVAGMGLEELVEASRQRAGNGLIHLKLDIQGMERRILEGSVALLSEISSIQVELSAMSIYTDAFRLSDAQAWMADAGFTLSALFPNNKGHFPTLFETDALFIRSSLIKG